MSKLNLSFNSKELDATSSMFRDNSETIHSVFEVFRKRVNNYQDNFSAEKTAILNSASTIALETKLHSPDAGVNIYAYSKFLAARAWEKTKGLISEAIGETTFAEQLIKLEILDREQEVSSPQDEGFSAERSNINVENPKFSYSNWRELDRFKNTKERSLRKFSLRLNYLDSDIITRGNLGDETKNKFAVNVKYSALRNLAETKAFYPDDQNYDNVINLLDRVSPVPEKISSKISNIADDKSDDASHYLTKKGVLADINPEIISDVIPFAENIELNKNVSLDNGLNIDFASLEKSILGLDQKNISKDILNSLKNGLAYLYVPPSYLKNSNSPEKVILFLKSKFVGYLNFGAEQKRALSLLVRDYYHEASSASGSLASSTKAGFLIRLEGLVDKANQYQEKAKNYPRQVKSYYQSRHKSIRYAAYVAGALVVSFGALSLVTLPSTHDAMTYLSNKFEAARLALSFDGSHRKANNRGKSYSYANIGKLKPLKAAENPLWVVVPKNGQEFEKNVSQSNGLSQAVSAPSNSLASNEINKRNDEIQSSSSSATGDISQSFNLGMQLILDKNSPERIQKGLGLIEQAANNNYPPAQYQMGRIYNSGSITKKDVQKAKKWFLLAAGSDYAPAMYELGVISYAAGPKEAPQAIDWFTKAAKKGVVDSQYNLGVMYLKGLGVRSNLKEAYKWFSVAATQGDLGASEKRDEIKSHLLLEEMDDVERNVSASKTSNYQTRIF